MQKSKISFDKPDTGYNVEICVNGFAEENRGEGRRI
jgi:hypothetical protein